VIDADPIAAAVRAVMAMRTEWTGTASDLLGVLAEAAGERVARSKTWVAFGREGRARTTIRITAAPEGGGTRPSTPSASSPTMPKVNGSNDFAADAVSRGRAGGRYRAGAAGIVRANPLKSNGETAADGADASFGGVAGWRGRL
jgi:hypothetical protein